MTSVTVAPKKRLTPFDLRAQIFRVNVKLSVYYHEQKNFRKNDQKCPFGSTKFWAVRTLYISDHWSPKNNFDIENNSSYDHLTLNFHVGLGGSRDYLHLFRHFRYRP